jgi:2-phospho-L-lactate guanylyltransferase
VARAARLLADQSMLALPGDIPLLQPDDVRQLLSAHRADRAFTIVPARDLRGSNAVICSPAAAVPLRFGSDSFYPHLDAARSCGIEPEVVRLPRIALDIDTPEDLALLLRTPAATRAHALLERWRVPLGALREVSV